MNYHESYLTLERSSPTEPIYSLIESGVDEHGKLHRENDGCRSMRCGDL